MVWIANTENGLDPNNSVIKRLWCRIHRTSKSHAFCMWHTQICSFTCSHTDVIKSHTSWKLPEKSLKPKKKKAQLPWFVYSWSTRRCILSANLQLQIFCIFHTFGLKNGSSVNWWEHCFECFDNCWTFLLWPQLRRSWWGILVSGCPSIRASIRVCVQLFAKKPCMLGFWHFHIWIPHGKIFDTHCFSCPSYLPSWSYAPLNKIRMKSDACHILWTMHVRVLKFHIWIPRGKIACLSCLPFWSYAPLKKSEWNLVSKISRKVVELGARNIVSW